MNDSTVMMSSELQGLIPELENETSPEYNDSAEVIYKIKDQDEELRSLLMGVSSDFEFDVLSDLKSALEIFKNRDDIILDNIRIIYQGTTIHLDGPFKLTGVKIKDINHARQFCTLGFKLLDKSNKQVIF